MLGQLAPEILLVIGIFYGGVLPGLTFARRHGRRRRAGG
jgi:hypothetical protein